MTISTTELMQQVEQNCRDMLEIVAECLNRSLESDFKLEIEAAVPWNSAENQELLSNPGICVVLETGQEAVLVAIPEILPLPVWYTTPDETQTSKLGTLGMEWSMSMMPEEYQGVGFQTHAVKNLWETIKKSNPDDDALCVPVSTDQDSKFLVIGLVKEFSNIAEPIAAAPVIASSAHAAIPVDDSHVQQMRQDAIERIKRIRRLIPLKVSVSVRLAEKKIEVKQLLNLSPGMLITFNKSCDDLLDLYVNNQLFCRGEAVKIGENFGIKINEVGSEQIEQSGILMI
jgi:flagellar motor switch protein FliN/FliY